jgi:hypothetical protein
MPRYVIERSVPGLNREMLDAAARRSVETAKDMPGLVWVRSYVSEAEGKLYCEYEAPDAALIRKHAALAGLPVDRISQVSIEIDPSMFR